MEELEGLHEACNITLSLKLKPRRDDADGFEKRAAAHTALYLLLDRQSSKSDCQELAAILYGIENTAAVRSSFLSFLKEAPRSLQHELIKTERDIEELKTKIAAAEEELERLRAGGEKPGLK